MLSPLLPETEYKLFCQAVQEACRHLSGGDMEAGCRCLQAGLERAREFAAGDEPWAADLARSYEHALEHYGCMEAPQPPAARRPHREAPRRMLSGTRAAGA